MKNTGLFIGGIITGAAIGASLALLFAPNNGEETRDQLKLKLKEMEAELDTIREKVMVKGGEIKDEMKAKMTEIETRIETLMKEYKKNLEPTHGTN